MPLPRPLKTASVVVVAALVAFGCRAKPEPTCEQADKPAVAPHAYDGSIQARLLKRFGPIRSDTFEVPANAALAKLGQVLFFDPRLSNDQTVACTTCHDLPNGGADTRPKAQKNEIKGRNTPSVLNIAGMFATSWDARSGDVEHQALGPLLNPDVMAMPNAEAVVDRLAKIPGYEPLFRDAFPGTERPLTFVNVGKAIGAYERRLATPGRWDRFLEGDKNALSTQEKEGLRTFLSLGCMVCHTGPLVGGTMLERVGVVEPWPNQEDPGRMKVTKNEVDRMVFRVPSLRNVTKTAPYFHDGSAATLPDAVRKMARHQLGIDLTPREIEAIVAWLGSLSGELPAELSSRPELPL